MISSSNDSNVSNIILKEPFVLQMTGIPCSGRATLSYALKNKLEDIIKMQNKVVCLESKTIRAGISSGLGYTENDRAENSRRIGEMTKMLG
jgi:adenylylsulfate kinase-like enzyme